MAPQPHVMKVTNSEIWKVHNNFLKGYKIKTLSPAPCNKGQNYWNMTSAKSFQKGIQNQPLECFHHLPQSPYSHITKQDFLKLDKRKLIFRRDTKSKLENHGILHLKWKRSKLLKFEKCKIIFRKSIKSKFGTSQPTTQLLHLHETKMRIFYIWQVQHYLQKEYKIKVENVVAT